MVAGKEEATTMNNFSEKVSFIWGVADLLRGDYRPAEYGRVILPLLVLRRLDQVLTPTREAVWKADNKHPSGPDPLSWTPNPCGRRSPRYPKPGTRIRRNFASSSSRWFVRGVRRRIWRASLN